MTKLDELVEAAANTANYAEPMTFLGNDRVDNWPEVVRAVLKELRVPTPKMVDAGRYVGAKVMWPGSVDVWQAMIDAALEEE